MSEFSAKPSNRFAPSRSSARYPVSSEILFLSVISVWFLPMNTRRWSRMERNLLEWMENRVDLDALLEIARSAPALEASADELSPLPDAHGLRIGYLRDSAFTFYYPENLEELERAGAELVPDLSAPCRLPARQPARTLYWRRISGDARARALRQHQFPGIPSSCMRGRAPRLRRVRRPHASGA